MWRFTTHQDVMHTDTHTHTHTTFQNVHKHITLLYTLNIITTNHYEQRHTHTYMMFTPTDFHIRPTATIPPCLFVDHISRRTYPGPSRTDYDIRIMHTCTHTHTVTSYTPHATMPCCHITPCVTQITAVVVTFGPHHYVYVQVCVTALCLWWAAAHKEQEEEDQHIITEALAQLHQSTSVTNTPLSFCMHITHVSVSNTGHMDGKSMCVCGLLSVKISEI